MKTVILAGGLGTRMGEETLVRPKPMIEIGGRPILWHIMKSYSSWGFNDFIICLGYKGFIIKEYFLNYANHNSDLTIDLKSNRLSFHTTYSEPWSVTLIDTGENTMTGGRLKRIAPLIGDEDFFCTYGDGVGNIDLDALLKLHQKEGRIATVTAAIPSSRFGAIKIDGNSVSAFVERPHEGDGWVSAGFFVFHPRVFDYIDGDTTSLELGPLQKIASDGQLTAYRHEGFWQPVDTLRDKQKLEKMWDTNQRPWLAR